MHVLQLKDEVAKSEQDLIEAKEKSKKQKAVEKQWEEKRDERVGDWRDFMNKKRGGGEAETKPKKAIGELKPPKLKTNDEDRLYVTRCVVEQFRPDQTLVKQKPNQMKNPLQHGPKK